MALALISKGVGNQYVGHRVVKVVCSTISRNRQLQLGESQVRKEIVSFRISTALFQ